MKTASPAKFVCTRGVPLVENVADFIEQDGSSALVAVHCDSRYRLANRQRSLVGLFSKAAAKSELNTVAAVEQALDEHTNLQHGRMTLQRHIVREPHTGLWVGQADGGRWLGIYRCQSHLWGVELSGPIVEGAKSGQDQTGWILISQLQGDRPVDLGLMANGVSSLAMTVGQIDFTDH